LTTTKKAISSYDLPPPPSPPIIQPFWKLNEPENLAAGAATQMYQTPDPDVPTSSSSSWTFSSSPPVGAIGAMNATLFLHEPDKVVQMFQDCENDVNCYVAYHHVPKTGGTTIEQALSKIFQQPHESSCCGNGLLQTFHDHTNHFCNNKYTSWQMDYRYFFEVLETCFQPEHNNNNNTQRRVLVLVTYREPISLTLSFIHQRCNKRLDKRGKKVQKACRACHYESHNDTWDRFADTTVEHLAGAWQVMHLFDHQKDKVTKPGSMNDDDHNHNTTTTSTATSSYYNVPFDRIQIAVMEPNDIDDFLTAWHPELQFEKANPEALSVCDFHMPKEYMDVLSPAVEWYRRFFA
jgi:hypothetical protein